LVSTCRNQSWRAVRHDLVQSSPKMRNW
jgi:hypothetical protein